MFTHHGQINTLDTMLGTENKKQTRLSKEKIDHQSQ